MDKSITNSDKIFEKTLIYTAVFILVLAGASLLKFNFFELPDVAAFTMAIILIVSAIVLMIQDIIFTIEDMLGIFSDHSDDQFQDIRENFRSTIKTLTFFNRHASETVGTHQIKLYDNKINVGPKEIAKGDLNLRFVPTFLDNESSLILMEGSSGTKLKQHTHRQVVSMFVTQGEVMIDYGKGLEQNETLLKGSSLTINPKVEREISFKQDSVVIVVYTPPLKSWSSTDEIPTRNIIEKENE